MQWRWTPVAITLVVIVVLSLYLSTAHRRWKKGWLSGLVAQRIAASGRKLPHKPRATAIGWRSRIAALRLSILEGWDALIMYLRDRFRTDMTAPYLPSLASFVVICSFLALFFLIPRPPALEGVVHFHWKDWWQLLTTDMETSTSSKMERLIVGAFTGLAVVVIALVVFVAESIRDDNDFERKRVLVRISWIWPLALAATVIPFGLLWSTTRGLTVLLEAIVAAITLLAFGRVIRALLDPDVRARGRVGLLRSRVRGMILDSARERVGNSILLEQLGSGKRIDALDYTISRVWIEGGAQSYFFIDAPEDGWLADIQLDELKTLVDRLDQYARDVLGFSLREGGPSMTTGISSATAVAPVAPLPVRKAYLLKRYREEVPQESVFYGKRRSLLALPDAFSSQESLLADLRAAIPHIFRFTKEEPSSVGIRREMQGTKDQLANAIRVQALGTVTELRKTYLEIAEEFLTLLVDLGGGYSAEQAAKERGSYYESWTEIRWLQTDLRELTIVAVDAGNIDILALIAYLPFSIATRAIQARDHFLFQQFYQFALLLYSQALDKPAGSRIRNWMIDRSWRWPKELADIYVAHELDDKGLTVGDLEQMRDFALYSLRVFQDVMRLMIDNRDVTSLATVATQFPKLYRGIRRERAELKAPIWRMQLERAQTEAQRENIRAELTKQEKRDEVSAALDAAIDQISVALGARVLAQLLAAPADPALRALMGSIDALLPTTLARLATIFAEARSFSVSDSWGWDQWDLVADGEARFIDTHSKLDQLFVARALQLLEGMQPEARETVELPATPAVADLAREDNPQGVLVTLNSIEASPGRWQEVLSPAAIACIGVLRQRLAAMAEVAKAAAAIRKRDALLDTEKLRQFREELLRHFADDGRLRRIFAAKGVLEMHLDEHADATVRSLGINQIDDKSAFIAQEQTTFVGWGRGYGEGMARGEDDAVFTTISEASGLKRSIPQGALVGAIETALAGTELTDPIVLQTLSFEAEYSEIRNNPAFTPKHAAELRSPWLEFNGFMGVLSIGGRQVPVFDALVQRAESRNQIVVLDPQRLLKWRQFGPNGAARSDSEIENLLLVSVIDLNADEAKRAEILAQEPAWLAQEADKDDYLRGRVLVTVQEKFRIDILDAAGGVCLTLAVPPE
jgi:hypothetical protein